ncbi:MAG: ubiquinone/menaquinone biosynthesis methyltransferase, partial [Bacteroidetes bacterium]|nr:ubiquinone/menaquinone biosynthesis methyltransferase [Bacteroidota bacterium]
DVATGTGDFAIRASKLCPQKITGIDISEKMLEIGRKKISKKGLEKIITLHSGEAEKLNFDDNSFDAVIVAFGVRNFENLSAGLNEIFRVLCCDGTVVILEFSRPYAFPLKQLYRLYFYTILPAIGKILSKNRSAYSYLPESVFRFPEGKEFTNLLKDTGFTDTVLLRLSGGIASVYRGTKKYPKISD